MNDFSLPSIYECISPECRFRFPVVNTSEQKSASVCPLCGSPTLLVEVSIQPQLKPLNKVETVSSIDLEVVVDNLRSANNIGAVFRTADGVGVNCIHLCGVTPTPPHPAIAKTSLGAEDHVRWLYHRNAVDLLVDKRKAGFTLLALEGGETSNSIFNADLIYKDMPAILVIGNEISGIDPGILRLCDQRLWIPMVGKKESLNVSTAFAIAAYSLKYRLSSPKNSLR